MKFEPIIKFMHAVQYHVSLSDICDSVTFCANDYAERLELVFRCSEKVGKNGGVVLKNYVSREFPYDAFFDSDFDYEESAKMIVENVERLFTM